MSGTKGLATNLLASMNQEEFAKHECDLGGAVLLPLTYKPGAPPGNMEPYAGHIPWKAKPDGKISTY